MSVSIEPKAPAEKKEFAPIAPGMYQVQILDIKDKMLPPYGAPKDSEATEPFYTFVFGILDEGEFRGRLLWKDVKPVAPVPPKGNAKPAKMWEIVSAILGKTLTYAEGIDFGTDKVNGLIGKQLKIFVAQTPPRADGKVFNNITGYIHADKELEELPPFDVASTDTLSADDIAAAEAAVN